MKKLLFLLTASLALLGTSATSARAQSYVDLLVRNFEYRFRPNTLQAVEGNTGFVQGLYLKTPDFPLWLLMDMGADLVVDKAHFHPGESTKDEAEGVWTFTANCIDSLNGFFSLHFAVDARTGEAALRIADHEEDLALYAGRLMPYQEEKPTFRNEKRAAEAATTEAFLASAIPARSFTVQLGSELYGTKANITVTPETISTDAPIPFKNEPYQVVCAQRQGQYWLVRFNIGDFGEIQGEDMLLDLAIDAYTGETNYRLGSADQLKLNWRSIVDGKIALP